MKVINLTPSQFAFRVRIPIVADNDYSGVITLVPPNNLSPFSVDGPLTNPLEVPAGDSIDFSLGLTCPNTTPNGTYPLVFTAHDNQGMPVRENMTINIIMNLQSEQEGTYSISNFTAPSFDM